MIPRLLLNTLTLIVLFLIQSGFLSGLPLFFSHINIILVALVFILILRGFYTALYWALGFGILFDLYFFLPVGSHLFSFIASLFVVNIFLTNVFTNRSLYSFLALSFLTVIFYKLSIYAIGYGMQFVTGRLLLQFSFEYFLSEIAGLGLDLAITAILFYIYSASSRRLKPVFIKT